MPDAGIEMQSNAEVIQAAWCEKWNYNASHREYNVPQDMIVLMPFFELENGNDSA
jgi:hypothetical protein